MADDFDLEATGTTGAAAFAEDVHRGRFSGERVDCELPARPVREALHHGVQPGVVVYVKYRYSKGWFIYIYLGYCR